MDRPSNTYCSPLPGKTIDYRADCGSEDPRTPNEEVPAKWEKWFEESQDRSLKYFIPDWDDLVDPRYDFVNERYSNSEGPDDRGSGGWDNEVFAHQLYDTPAYDGILVSREVLRKSRQRKERMEDLGSVQRYLRVPSNFPVMGDCGAFGYIDQDEPPYSVDDVLDYYTRYGFSHGISVDHLVFGASDQDGRQYRYDVTLKNARRFYNKHQRRGLKWTPMAAVQGWDVESYVDAAQACVNMGYTYLAVGGLVRSSTKEVILILRKIREAVGEGVDLHALGVARFAVIEDYLEIGVTSMDSATYLRRAWTSRKDNYWSRDHLVFSAIRVPGPKRSLQTKARKDARKEAERRIDQDNLLEQESWSEEKAKAFIEEKVKSAKANILDERLEDARDMEADCFQTLRAYDSGSSNALTTTEVVDLLDVYQNYVGRKCFRDHYWAMLHARPWESCGCAICENSGIEVAIFRGNNRNRRRGFHNTRVFYDLLSEIQSGAGISIQRGADVYSPSSNPEGGGQEPSLQHDLF